MAYVLFISEDRLKSSTTIGLNVDPALLLPYIKQAQKLYIETKLGTDLNQKLKDLIVAGTVNSGGNEAYATLLNGRERIRSFTFILSLDGNTVFALQD
jgi:hypothetical protein